MLKTPVFTAIIDTYYRPALLKEAVEALFRQTYENLEIILVNNGATEETVEYLHQVEKLDRRVKLVHFKENQFSWEKPAMVVNCWNAALEVAEGDYVWYQGDDDLIADDYAEKMVALFQGHSECTTAAGLPHNIDLQGNIIDPGPRSSNFRPRYMPGHYLALDNLDGGRFLYRASGTVFTIKRDALVKAGGYHCSILLSHLYGILPFGVTGFDETALIYWRRHEGQLGSLGGARGWIGIDEDRALLKEWEIERRWQVFGSDVAKRVVSTLEKRTCQHAADWFLISLGAWRFHACLRIFPKMWYRTQFWKTTLANPKELLLSPLWRLLKPSVRKLFKVLPTLASLSPRLATFRDWVNR